MTTSLPRHSCHSACARTALEAPAATGTSAALLGSMERTYETAANMFRADAIELARRGEINQSQALAEMAAWCETHAAKQAKSQQETKS